MISPRRELAQIVGVTGAPRVDLAALPEPPAWMGDALCAQISSGDDVTDSGFSTHSNGAAVFFPTKGGSPSAAKRVCAGCAVRVPCLQYALDNGERFGIWGGLSERERRRLTRSRLDGVAQ